MSQASKTLLEAGRLNVSDGSGNNLKVLTVTADTTLTADDSGKVVLLSAAGGCTVTLPAVATAGAGWHAKFIVKTNPVNDHYVIQENTATDTNVIIGSFSSSDSTAGESQDVTETGQTQVNMIANLAVAGDRLELVGDATNYYVTDGHHKANVAFTFT